MLHIIYKMRCDKKLLNSSVLVETMLDTKHIPARNCILSNWIVGCMRVKCLMYCFTQGNTGRGGRMGEYKRELNFCNLR